VLIKLAERVSYVSEFQTEAALTLKALAADNASVARGVNSNSLSDDRNMLWLIAIHE